VIVFEGEAQFVRWAVWCLLSHKSRIFLSSPPPRAAFWLIFFSHLAGYLGLRSHPQDFYITDSKHQSIFVLLLALQSIWGKPDRPHEYDFPLRSNFA
jgi:hypothetical protein